MIALKTDIIYEQSHEIRHLSTKSLSLCREINLFLINIKWIYFAINKLQNFKSSNYLFSKHNSSSIFDRQYKGRYLLNFTFLICQGISFKKYASVGRSLIYVTIAVRQFFIDESITVYCSMVLLFGTI